MGMENDQEHSIDDSALREVVKKDAVTFATQPKLSWAQSKRPETFTLFPKLPPDIRIMVYQAYVDEHSTAIPVRTLEMEPRDDGLLMLTRHRHNGELWQMSPEARYEAERLSIILPTLRLTFEGANVYSVNTGAYRVLPKASLAIGPRLTHRETICFVPRNIAQRMFWQSGYLPLKTFPALRNVLLDNQIFVSMLQGPAMQSQFPHRLRQPGALLTAILPNLRKLMVGFTNRWQDVALIEGPRAEDIVTVIEVINTPAGVCGALPTWQLASPVPVHPGLQVIVISTVSMADRYVERIRRGGVDFAWVIVQASGILRRREVIEGYEGLASVELSGGSERSFVYT